MERNRLLVVDDELFIRELLCEYFAKLGYIVKAADSAAAAIQLVETDLFEVALIDLKMPDLGGNDLMKLMKKCSPEMSMVLMTGYPTVETVVQALRDGASDYVIKPFRLAELLTIVTRVFEDYARKNQLMELQSRVSRLEKRLNRQALAGQNNIANGNRILTVVDGPLDIEEGSNSVLVTQRKKRQTPMAVITGESTNRDDEVDEPEVTAALQGTH
jgi:two-component system response regulator FlrC